MTFDNQRAILQHVVRLVLLHDRSIQSLEDRSSITILLWSQELRISVLEARDTWKAADPSQKHRSKDNKKAQEPGDDIEVDEGAEETGLSGDKKEQWAAHPLKCSLRSCIHAVILSELRKTWTASQSSKKDQKLAAIGTLLDYPSVEVDKNAFRLKSQHREPHKDATRPWAWTLLFADGGNVKYREAWTTLAEFTPDDARETKVAVAIRPAKSQDGGLSKLLREYLKGNGSRFNIMEQDMWGAEEDTEGQKNRKKRR